MAITIEANYQKRLGLPNYSSHAYSVTIKTEVSNLSKIEEASQHLYRQLQDAVDRDIQQTGFLPGDDVPAELPPFQRGGTQGSAPRQSRADRDEWNSSDKQRGLIERMMSQHNIPFNELDELSHERFGSGLKGLNKMQASGLIDELFDTYSKSKAGRARR